MGLLYYLSYAAIVAGFGFVTLSLASGLLYVSELIEEHSHMAKSIGQRGIYAIIVLHVVLYMTDSLPLSRTLFSIICHVVYLQNFSNAWPLISLSSPTFIASSILVISDHFLWFFYFSSVTHAARNQRSYRPEHVQAPSFAEIATFFGICVWLAPLFLFLSLSANENALPLTTAAEPGSPRAALQQIPPSRVSLFRSMFSGIDVPLIRPRASRRDTSEGIIAPRSPNPARSPMIQSLTPSSSLSSVLAVNSSPPRTPKLTGEDASFKLQTPPRRADSLRARSRPQDGRGLGLGSSPGLDRDEFFSPTSS
ncbi:transmembrane adaptor Erv26-domain-containing protein [Mycena floridula]|nr:transmembrane adaptor Erv26-domain-containing protein [Mycena floridula]